jgi:hypothetical protein
MFQCLCQDVSSYRCDLRIRHDATSSWPTNDKGAPVSQGPVIDTHRSRDQTQVTSAISSRDAPQYIHTVTTARYNVQVRHPTVFAIVNVNVNINISVYSLT